MAALTKPLSQETGADIDVEGLKTILIFCGAGLLLSLVVVMAYGLNPGAGALLGRAGARPDLRRDREYPCESKPLGATGEICSPSFAPNPSPPDPNHRHAGVGHAPPVVPGLHPSLHLSLEGSRRNLVGRLSNSTLCLGVVHAVPHSSRATVGGPKAHRFAAWRLAGTAIELAQRLENLVDGDGSLQSFGSPQGWAR